MTVKEYYEDTNSNYTEAMERFMDEARIKKYLKLFFDNACYKELCQGMESKNAEQAFRAVHAMKGITANMAFSSLNRLSILLTEELRGRTYTEQAEKYYMQFCKEYEQAEKDVVLLD